MLLFISYSRRNDAAVDRLRRDLQEAGIEVWIDRAGLTPGTFSWEQALRDAIAQADAVLLCASPDSRRSAYVRDEVALAIQASKTIYPAWVAGDDWLDCVPLGLGGAHYADLRDEHYAEGFAQLLAAIGGEHTAVEPFVAERSSASAEQMPPDFTPRNPYKGLRAFRQEDRRDFFGREALVRQLVEQIQDDSRAARMLAVLGASGSGKSSVIMAGLIPRLRAMHPDWIFLDPIVPGTQPLEKLTITLARHLGNKSQAAIREDLTDASTRGLHRLSAEISDKPVVLYIDQFEELFTLVDSDFERRQVIDLLSRAITEPGGSLILVLSMRADFYDRPLQFMPFGELLETHHVAITPMTLADLHEVVQGPAALPDVRLRFEDDLVTKMIFAVREEHSALPLLQFTLDQLFAHRIGQTFTLAAYHELGGIQGALARHAETTYQKLPSDQHRDMARALFLRLIEAGQTEQDTTRRRATYHELTLPEAEQTRILQQTADIFIDARLLVSDQSGDVRSVEVSHEALIREWGRLGEWLHEAREDLRLQKSLAADVAEWRRRGHPGDMLYRGIVLAEALAWAERNTTSRDEVAFLDKSRSAEAEMQSREIANRRRLRLALGSLALVILIASLGLALIFAQNNAELRAEADFVNLEIARFSTLRAGGLVVPLNTQTPGIFEPTMTAVALLNDHDPALPDNQMIDEHGVAMVRVPAGCFFMGSDRGEGDELPVHEICFDAPFWIDQTEISQGQFGRLGGQKSQENQFSGPDLPVEKITWFEARDYCETVRGARLPTEAEWEYAARGPDSLVYPWGHTWEPDAVIWRENSDNQTALVGEPESGASWVGALNMGGNVQEWTSSLYAEYPYEADHEKPDDDSSARVIRGSSYSSGDAFNFRVTNRSRNDPNQIAVSFGFRCVRDD